MFLFVVFLADYAVSVLAETLVSSGVFHRATVESASVGHLCPNVFLFDRTTFLQRDILILASLMRAILLRIAAAYIFLEVLVVTTDFAMRSRLFSRMSTIIECFNASIRLRL